LLYSKENRVKGFGTLATFVNHDNNVYLMERQTERQRETDERADWQKDRWTD
jgi:hypothetical protein